MPASKATLRNAQQKANREAGIGDASGRLPARVKDEKPKLSCEICKVLLECTKQFQHQIKRFVHVSTDEVYGESTLEEMKTRTTACCLSPLARLRQRLVVHRLK